MRFPLLLAAGSVGLVILTAFGPGRAAEPGRTPIRLEVARLQAHFDSVDSELRQADVSGLDQAQLTSRRQLIGWLREYRDAGEFPVNDRFHDRYMPFFRDSRGVLCAMAWLVARSGRADIVDRIARTRNNAFIPELAGDEQLTEWLDSVGLTVAEAARIQPSYGGNSGISTGYAITSVILSGGTLVAGGFNLFAPTTTSGWLGIGTGLGAGIAAFSKAFEPVDDGTAKLATVNLLAGVLGVALGVRGVLAADRKPEPNLPRSSTANRGIELNILPSTFAVGGMPRLGVVVEARF